MMTVDSISLWEVVFGMKLLSANCYDCGCIVPHRTIDIKLLPRICLDGSWISVLLGSRRWREGGGMDWGKWERKEVAGSREGC